MANESWEAEGRRKRCILKTADQGSGADFGTKPIAKPKSRPTFSSVSNVAFASPASISAIWQRVRPTPDDGSLAHSTIVPSPVVSKRSHRRGSGIPTLMCQSGASARLMKVSKVRCGNKSEAQPFYHQTCLTSPPMEPRLRGKGSDSGDARNHAPTRIEAARCSTLPQPQRILARFSHDLRARFASETNALRKSCIAIRRLEEKCVSRQNRSSLRSSIPES